MKLIAVLHTLDYRGDHSTDIAELHEIKYNETVRELAERLFDTKDPNLAVTRQIIQIKVVKEPS